MIETVVNLPRNHLRGVLNPFFFVYIVLDTFTIHSPMYHL